MQSVFKLAALKHSCSGNEVAFKYFTSSIQAVFKFRSIWSQTNGV